MDKQELKNLAFSWGIDFFGVAGLESFRKMETLPSDLLAPYKSAISLGLALSRGIFNNLSDGPTPHYSQHYTTVNALLDHVAMRLTGCIQRTGFEALPIPASQVLDWEDWRGAVTHKAIARMAGIGWQGKSLLLVNPKVGPRIRLATILTDLDLQPDSPLPNGCGKCMECARACPAGAIRGTSFGDGYSSRGEAWDMLACTNYMVQNFNNRPGVEPWICGLCIKACPIGRAAKKF